MWSTLLWYFSKLICHNNTFSLRWSCRFCYPKLFLIFFHLCFKISELVWKQECFWYKVEMFCPMNLTHLRYLFVHQIFPCDIVRLRKVIYLLISEQALIDLWFHSRAAPHDGPILAFLLWNFSKTVIFKSVSDDLDIAFMKLEVVTAIRGLEWTNRNRVFIWPKHKVLLFKFCYDWFWSRIIRYLFKLRCISCW